LQRVLVTGASGFVGRHLAAAIAARGDQGHGFGLGEPPAESPLTDWRSGDMLDREAVEAAVAASRPDAVIHLAGQSSPAVSFEQPVQTYRTNAMGTWTLLEAVRQHAPRARVLVVGSADVYGPQPEGSRVAEDAPLRPISPYGLSKAAADALSDAFGRRHGLAVIRTRSFGHTGPGQSPAFALPSFARQIAAIEAGRAEPVLRVGNLDVTRDVTDVREVVTAYLTLLARGRAGAAYNVCRGEGVKLRAAVDRMVALARVPVRVEVDPARVRPVDVAYLVGEPAAMARDTGWRAAMPLDRTLEDVLQDWRGRSGES
jgi:GDP-4-dehydro-6-deoxy-D-mannose reductase